MKVDYFNLGRAIARRRIELGFTQARLAELCDLSASYIGCIERADRKISIDSLVALCYALNVSPNWLLYESLPDDVFGDLLDSPLKLREPDHTLRNTLTNWYFSDLPDESRSGEPPVTQEQLSRLEFALLGDELPELLYPPFS